MTCEKCGTALRDDQIYCPECGAEVQLVANYNPTEEELMGIDMNIVAPDTSAASDNSDGVNPAGKKGLSTAMKAVIICLVILAVIIGIVTAVVTSLQKDYGYQFGKASDAYNDSDFKAALDRGLAASALDPKNIDAKWMVARAYAALKQYEDSLETIKEILVITSNDAEVYSEGMDIFTNAGEYKCAAALLETTTDVNLREKYSAYLASPPDISVDGGRHTSEPEVELTASGNCKIYYTLDKEDPASGTEYTEPIIIPAGDHILRAVSVNQFGVTSSVTQIEYNVTPGIPDMPEILPSGVNIVLGTMITINAPEGSRIFYTWDGSEPTINSYEYQGPMQAPEGNNILSVIVVDKYGQTSNVAKKNYIVN